MNDKPIADPLGSPSPWTPRQFRLIDVFALVTLAAILCAMAAPFVRTMAEGNLTRLVVVVLLQALAAAASIAFLAAGRRALLAKSGRRIGVGYSGSMRWRHGPVFASILRMLLFGGWQLVFAVVFVFLPSRHTSGQPEPAGATLTYVLVQLELGGFAGYALLCYLWRVYPKSIEFFENGIAKGGLQFTPWSKMKVRPSQSSSDQIIIVHTYSNERAATWLWFVQVPESLREWLLAAHAEGPDCHTAVP